MQWNIKFLAVLLIGLAPLPPVVAEPAAASKSGGELGLWVWRRESVLEADARKALVGFCGRHGINRLLVQVRFEGEPGALKFADGGAFRDLLKRTSEAGIAVEALEGAHDMGLEARRGETLERLDAILAFQSTLPSGARLAGVHYDIEPYLNPRWKAGDKQGVMRETLETFAKIREKVTADSGLTLAHDIPAFYDRHEEALAIDFHGETKNFHQHIQDLSDYVGVMSYRRKALGPNGIVELCAAEIAYGEKIGKRVYPSMETGKLSDEAHISFYGSDAETFLGELKAVQEAQKDSPAFGGVLLHHYNALKDLLEPEGH